MNNVKLLAWDAEYFIQHLRLRTQIVFINLDLYQPSQQHFAAVLSEEELNRANKFLKPTDSQRYLLARYALKKILAILSGQAASEISIGYTASKKPVFNGWEFNITHSGNHIYIAFSLHSVGIDAEIINPSFTVNDIVSTCFSAEETRLFYQQNNPEFFYTVWTRKEALLKATGEGLCDNLNEIDVMENEVFRQGKNYCLHSLRHQHYVVSYASQHIATSEFFWLFQ